MLEMGGHVKKVIYGFAMYWEEYVIGYKCSFTEDHYRHSASVLLLVIKIVLLLYLE